MKIVLQGYNTCCQNTFGGIQKRIRKIYKLLQDKGLNVELFDPFKTVIDSNTILHVFMLNFENYQLIKCVKERGGYVVISTVQSLDGGCKIDFCVKLLNKFPILTSYKMYYEMLCYADCLITETKQEKEFIEKHYGITKSKIYVVSNGVEVNNRPGEEIFDKIGGKKEYILVVGRFDENKNQLNVIRAFLDTDINVVFIGGADFNCRDYYEKCKKTAGDEKNFFFLGWIEANSPIIASAYANAKALVIPSFQETFGFVIVEAAIYGTRIVGSKTIPLLRTEAFDRCHKFNPHSPKDIKRAVEKSINESLDDSLKKVIEMQYSWEDIINQHIEIYSILEGKRQGDTI